MPDNARRLVAEFMMLRNIDQSRRTPEQTARYYTFAQWYSSIYRPWDEMVTALEASKRTDQAAELRKSPEAISKPCER